MTVLHLERERERKRERDLRERNYTTEGPGRQIYLSIDLSIYLCVWIHIYACVYMYVTVCRRVCTYIRL
jgi:hypothetical protein